MKSENIGGIVSMAGSSLFLAGGNLNGILVTTSFIAAELVLTGAGHRRFGYSIGCALFALGDAAAIASQLALGNRSFQLTLAVIAAAWAAGALRAPGVWMGHRLHLSKLADASDALQPLVGVIVLVLRVPALFAAVTGGSYLGAVAIACWAVSDVLIGRLQNLVRSLRRR